MICKIKHGQNFQGCLDYITGKYDKDKQAKVIMHSEGIPLLDNKTVAQIFEAYATKGSNNIREPVGHYAYSFHKKDGNRVTNELIRKIVREHLELMGIVFTDGKYTFSGRLLDNELKLSALTEKFGDLKQITHDNVRDWYEDYRQQLHYVNNRQGCMAIDKAYPDFDKLFPNGKLPSGGYTSTDGLLSHISLEYQTDFQAEHENSKDGKTSFVALELLCDLLLMPYAQPLSIGGGGGGNNRGWRDLDDDDKEKYRFRFNYSHSNNPQFKRKR